MYLLLFDQKVPNQYYHGKATVQNNIIDSIKKIN